MKPRAELRGEIEPAHTHEDRLAVAREVVEMCLQVYGDKVAAIGIYGSTAVERDGPFSDLDITVLTNDDLGQETKCYSLDGLCVNIDYQTVVESVETEVSVPGSGGCWTSFLTLYDRDGVVTRLRDRYEALTEEDARREFAIRLRDHLNTYIGKVRNAVLAGDRSSLVLAALNLGMESCRALEILNGHYTTGVASLREEVKTFSCLPRNFEKQIDTVMAAVASDEDELYNSAEDLWMGMKDLASRHGITWMHSGVEV